MFSTGGNNYSSNASSGKASHTLEQTIEVTNRRESGGSRTDISRATPTYTGPGFDLEPRHNSRRPDSGKATSPIENWSSTTKSVSSADVSRTDVMEQKWNIESSLLISSEDWLKIHGLKRAKLDMNSLLKQMGFKHSNEYDQVLKMPVCSRYGVDLFQKYFRPDGKAYNVIMSTDAMKQIELRLSHAVKLYQERLDWLNSDSRRLFGVIQEKCICIVLDFRSLSKPQFDLYVSSLVSVLREQVSHISRFNLIRAQENPLSFGSELVYVSKENIDAAVKWLNSLDREAPVGRNSTCEALAKAAKLSSVEAVYLFTEGCSTDTCQDVLHNMVKKSSLPVHVVSHNCTNRDTINFLMKLAKNAGGSIAGRFHAYAVTVELDLYERTSVDISSGDTAPSLVQRKKVFGGVPNGVGVREDVIQIFEELEEARNVLSQIQSIMKERDQRVASEAGSSDSAVSSGEQQKDETYMSSEEWLKHHGLKARKLGFYDVLSSVAFKHEDGVLDLKVAPPCADDYIVDALTVRKLVNAKYCDKFAHVIWKDGRVMHVNVTNELFRSYKERLEVACGAMQRRIDWLLRGSREIFGTVVEDQIYLCIDTSLSMQIHMPFVKEKISLLLQEQLRHKQLFNIIAFDTLVRSWHSSVVEVSEENLRSAWSWVKDLVCHGTTNTLGALQLALKDKQTKAVYLLTDGRPDHPPKSIIAQCKYRYNIPVHTISFNCNDREANEFLFDLARETGGRFHYYSMSGHEIDRDGPTPWQSEDIARLRQELHTAQKFLDRMEELHSDCTLLAKDKGDAPSVRKPAVPIEPSHGLAMPAVASKGRSGTSRLFGGSTKRPMSAPSYRYRSGPSAESAGRPQTALGYQNWARTSAADIHSSIGSAGLLSPKLDPAAGSLFAKHTRTSLVRTSNSSGRFMEPEPLLPETRELFERQELRKKKILREEEKKRKRHKQKNNKMVDTNKLSSKRWLAKYGLSAKKLTILDLLAPTFIAHEPSYVPSLDKEVMSKVFDDVMNIGYAELMKRRMFLTNPLAVDFDGYQKKVRDAQELYKKRLDHLVWNGLTENEKLEFNSDVPMSFVENQSKLLAALDRCGSPVRLTDIRLLEREIQRAEQYIEQATKLKAAAENAGQGLPEYRDSAHDGGSKESKKKKQPEPKPDKKIKVSHSPVQQKGLRVIGRNDDDGFFYPGIVAETIDRRRVKVDFDSPDLGQKILSTRYVIPIGGAIAWPTIYVSDYVLCRVKLKNVEQECYVPGKVVGLPQRRENRFYSVQLYTGQQEQFMRSSMVKTNKILLCFTIQYILQKAGVPTSDLEADDQEPEPIAEEAPTRDPVRTVDKKAAKLLDNLRQRRQNLTMLISKLRKQYIRLHSTRNKSKDACLQTIKELNEEIQRLKGRGSGSKRSGNVEADEDREAREDSSSRKQKFPLVNEGEEVLARWSDDGWFYQGIIKTNLGDDSYIVEDSTGYKERIWREDIIADTDGTEAFEREDAHHHLYAVVLHPDYEFSYCPAKVTPSSRNRDEFEARFYDGVKCRVPRENVYAISREKYTVYVKYIKDKENELVGQVVVARKDDSGIYQIGEAGKESDKSRTYTVFWADGTVSDQLLSNMFGSFTHLRAIAVRDYVLAPTADIGVFLPAEVIAVAADRSLTVKYCDGTTRAHVSPAMCFWLSSDMFRSQVNYIRQQGVVRVAIREEELADSNSEDDELDDEQSNDSDAETPAKTAASSSSSRSGKRTLRPPSTNNKRQQPDDDDDDEQSQSRDTGRSSVTSGRRGVNETSPSATAASTSRSEENDERSSRRRRDENVEQDAAADAQKIDDNDEGESALPQNSGRSSVSSKRGKDTPPGGKIVERSGPSGRRGRRNGSDTSDSDSHTSSGSDSELDDFY